MGTHFLSVLGTGLYEPVVYGIHGEDGSAEQEFVQIALMELFAKQLNDGGKITILLTKGAKKSNWEDRAYTGKDVEASGKWVSVKKQTVRESDTKIGMKSTLENDYPELYKKINVVEIQNASTEEEIWSVFDAIYHTIDEGDEIIFDITHSFRSIPMLAMTIINYAKVMKNCTLKGIYYGAYEAREIRDGIQYAPIVDLTVYNEILEWTNAAEAFMQYGVAAKMKEVYDSKMASIAGDKSEWEPIRKKVKAMQDLSMAIFTCRGADMRGENGRGLTSRELRSIKNAYIALMEKNTKKSKNKAKEIKPLYPLLEKIGSSYDRYFGGGKDNVGIGCGMVEWSIKNNMIQQGYTALEETMKTYLCKYYEINDLTLATREDMVGRIITGIPSKCRKKATEHGLKKSELKEILETVFKEEKDKQCMARELLADMVASQHKDKGWRMTEKDKKKIKEIVLTIPIEFLELCDRVKDKRNDINHFGFHFGFCKKPAKSYEPKLDESKTDELEKGLKEYLKEYYDDFIRIKREMDQEKESKG